ncbi:hypothetical protein Cni_G21734 [Canna indica]|uniref:ABC transporter domain-containing protein n=1 Tax=Canna indica TaxID=4628 RepID=A0AAQ3KRE4_9LILI|nr:hypothetical protein Cni_G21734 [Canna indica]
MEIDRVQMSEERDGGARHSIFRKAQRPLFLKFENVVYKVKTTTTTTTTTGHSSRGGKSVKQSEKVILKGISGSALPGEMTVMLGPSGSGKTTLLTLLGGRVSTTHRLTGSITYNGSPFSSSLKRGIGFVTQDDLLYPHLTVDETLYYTALLRLPKTHTREEKAKLAEAVMEQLGLTACRNGIIGGPLLRGISGGERKRVSIGQEMLINPSLLLLDEPTSGLDSTTAGRIVSTLWELSRGSRTVVMTIHQPSSRLFYMFDKILLLSEGNPVYYGKGSEAMGYFASIGHSPTVAMNPADFLLDLANGVSSDGVSAEEDRASTKEALVSAYKLHLEAPVAEELSGLCIQCKQDESEKATKTKKWCTSWSQQFSVLLERDLKERKHEAFSSTSMLQVFAIAILCGILWFRSSRKPEDQLGLLFFVNGFWGFFPAFEAIYTFPQERTMLSKERSSGMYRLSSYFAARMVGDLPMELILPVAFVSIMYWMTGLKRRAANFFMTLATILLNVLVSQGLGLAIGALVMDVKSAGMMASVIMQAFMLTGGFYMQHLPAFIGWIKYVSFNYYSFKLQLVSQFSRDETYQCTPTTRCRIADMPTAKMVGFDHVPLAVVMLFIMLVFYRLVAYVGLMRVGAKN